MLHEEVDAVFLARDGVGRVFGDLLRHGDAGDVELDAGGGAAVFADGAGDDEGAFEGETFEGGEDLFGDLGLGHDALYGAGAVAEGGKEELAGGAEVVEPAAQDHCFADVLFKVGDGGEGGCGAGRGGAGGGTHVGVDCSRRRGGNAAGGWRAARVESRAGGEDGKADGPKELFRARDAAEMQAGLIPGGTDKPAAAEKTESERGERAWRDPAPCRSSQVLHPTLSFSAEPAA